MNPWPFVETANFAGRTSSRSRWRPPIDMSDIPGTDAELGSDQIDRLLRELAGPGFNEGGSHWTIRLILAVLLSHESNPRVYSRFIYCDLRIIPGLL
jgi:hypothetical protein